MFTIAAYKLSARFLGCNWPAFSVFIGQVFKSLTGANEEQLTQTQRDDIMNKSLMNGAALATIGVLLCASIYFSGSLMSKAGENMTMRLRLAVYKVGERRGRLYITQKIDRDI